MPARRPFLSCAPRGRPARPAAPRDAAPRPTALRSDRCPVLDTPMPPPDELTPWLRVGTVCALAPLVAGLATFGLWLLTDSLVFEILGFFVAVAGTLAMLCGALCIGVHLIEAARTGRRLARADWLQSAAVLVLLLANYPAARLILDVAPQVPLQ